MTLTAREMTVAETDLVIDYFHSSTPEYLETLGVDPSRMHSGERWREGLEHEFARPDEQRSAIVVIWLSDQRPIGFSSSDKITYGEQANMHLHVTDPERRNRGVGAECVRRSVDIYFDRRSLKQTVSGPTASNPPPDRTL